MLWMDSQAQSGIGLSKRNSSIRFEKVYYVQTKVAQFWKPQNCHELHPENIVACFLYYPDLKNLTRFTSTLQITRKPFKI